MATVFDIPVTVRPVDGSLFDTVRQETDAFSRNLRRASEDFWKKSFENDHKGDLLGWGTTALPRMRNVGAELCAAEGAALDRASRNRSRSSSLVRRHVEIRGAAKQEVAKRESSGTRVHDVEIQNTGKTGAEGRGRSSSQVHHVEIRGAAKQEASKRESSSPHVHHVEIHSTAKKEESNKRHDEGVHIMEINSTQQQQAESSSSRVHNVEIRGTAAQQKERRDSSGTHVHDVEIRGTATEQKERRNSSSTQVHDVEIRGTTAQQKERRNSGGTQVHDVEIRGTAAQQKERRDSSGTCVHDVKIRGAANQRKERRESMGTSAHVAEKSQSHAHDHGEHATENVKKTERMERRSSLVRREEAKSTCSPRVHQVEIQFNKTGVGANCEEKPTGRAASRERRIPLISNADITKSNLPNVHDPAPSYRLERPRNFVKVAIDTKLVHGVEAHQQKEERRSSIVREEVIKAAEKRRLVKLPVQVHPVEIHSVEDRGGEERAPVLQMEIHQKRLEEEKKSSSVCGAEQLRGRSMTLRQRTGRERSVSAEDRQNLLAEIRSRGGKAGREESLNRKQESRNMNQEENSFKQVEIRRKEDRFQEDSVKEDRFVKDRFQEDSVKKDKFQERFQKDSVKEERFQDDSVQENRRQEGKRSSSVSREVKIEHLDAMRRTMSRKSEINKDFLVPRLLTGDSPTRDDLLVGLEETEGGLVISLDTKGYRPSELAVSVTEGEVRVEGSHEERAEDGQVMVRRQLRRLYSLPAGTQPDRVFSSLSQDGILRITAPKEDSRPVNIQIK